MEGQNGDVILNPIRFKIVKLLASKPMSASEIAHQLGIDLKLAIFHLKKLAKRGIVKNRYIQRTVQNRPVLIRYYSLTDYANDYLKEIAEFSKQLKDRSR